MEKLLHTIAPQLAVAGAYSFIGEIKGVVFELRWMLVFIQTSFSELSTAWSRGERISGLVGLADGRCASLLSTTAIWFLDSCWASLSCNRLVYAAIPFRPCAALDWPSCLSSTLSWSIWLGISKKGMLQPVRLSRR